MDAAASKGADSGLVLHDVQAHVGLGAILDCLEQHAIALYQFQQLIALGLRCVSVDIKAQADLRETHGYVLRDAERPAADITADLSGKRSSGIAATL